MRPPIHTPEEQAIVAAAPLFFDTTGIRSPWSERGFEIGPGWHTIVKEMAVAIEAVAPDVRCTQCKEKLGYLRVYTRMGPSTTEEMRLRVHAIINAAVRASVKTCEKCGGGGRLICVDGWWCVRCVSCTPLNSKQVEDEEDTSNE